MQRPIKFRAWDKKEKVMDEPFNLYSIGYVNGENGYDAKYYILLQFTGLHDKNGKEIYEGDIVDLIPEGYMPYSVEVRWDDDFACFGFWGVRQDDSGKKCGIISIDRFLNHAKAYKSMKVIGNIHENPKLGVEQQS